MNDIEFQDTTDIPCNYSEFISVFNKTLKVINIICCLLPSAFKLPSMALKYHVATERYLKKIMDHIYQGMAIEYIITSQQPYNHDEFPKYTSAFSYVSKKDTISAKGFCDIYRHIKYSNYRKDIRDKVLEDEYDWSDICIMESIKNSFCSMSEGVILINISCINNNTTTLLNGRAETYKALEIVQIQLLIRCLLRMSLYNFRTSIISKNIIDSLSNNNLCNGNNVINKDSIFGNTIIKFDPFGLEATKINNLSKKVPKDNSQVIRKSLRVSIVNFGRTAEIWLRNVPADAWSDVVDEFSLVHPMGITRTQSKFKEVDRMQPIYINLSELIKTTIKDTKIANVCNVFICLINKLVLINKKYIIYSKSNKISHNFFLPRSVTSLFTDVMSKSNHKLDSIKIYHKEIKQLLDSGKQSEIDILRTVLKFNEMWIIDREYLNKMLKLSSSSYPIGTTCPNDTVMLSNEISGRSSSSLILNNKTSVDNGGNRVNMFNTGDVRAQTQAWGQGSMMEDGVYTGSRCRQGPDMSMVKCQETTLSSGKGKSKRTKTESPFRFKVTPLNSEAESTSTRVSDRRGERVNRRRMNNVNSNEGSVSNSSSSGSNSGSGSGSGDDSGSNSGSSNDNSNSSTDNSSDSDNSRYSSNDNNSNHSGQNVSTRRSNRERGSNQVKDIKNIKKNKKGSKNRNRNNGNRKNKSKNKGKNKDKQTFIKDKHVYNKDKAGNSSERGDKFKPIDKSRDKSKTKGKNKSRSRLKVKNGNISNTSNTSNTSNSTNRGTKATSRNRVKKNRVKRVTP